MKTCLLFMGLIGVLSACKPIELSVSQTPIQEQDLPYKTYQGIGNTCQATDGGLVTVLVRTASNLRSGQSGSTTSLSASRVEVTVVKTDLQGQLQWTKLIWAGVFQESYKPFIHAMSDGGYAVFISFLRYAPAPGPMIVRLTNAGDVVSQQPIVGLQSTEGFTPHRTISLPDKGFIIGAITSTGNPSLLLMRFDERAQLLWSRKYEQSLANTNTYRMAATSDGGLFVAWAGYNSATSQNETYLLKVAMDGQQSWFKRYALFGTDPVVSESTDKGYILLEKGVPTSMNPTSLILYKLDKEAAIKWSRVYALGGTQYVTPRGIFAFGDTYVALYSSSYSGMEFLTTDLSGAEQNRQNINGPSFGNNDSDALRLSDGSFVYGDRSAQGQFSLTKSKPDKTLHWRVPIATSN